MRHNSDYQRISNDSNKQSYPQKVKINIC